MTTRRDSSVKRLCSSVTLSLAVLLLLLLAEASSGESPTPLTVHYEYQVGGGVVEEERKVLERALEVVSGYLERSFVVKRPADDRLYLDAPCRLYVKWSGGDLGPREVEECIEYEISTCGEAVPNEDLYGSREVCSDDRPRNCRTEQGGPGVSEQLVIYVTVDTARTCSDGNTVGEIASAVQCTKSWKDQRPTSGNINVCPGTLQKAVENEVEFNHLVDTLTHEAFHLLGFNPGLFTDFVDASGNPLGEDKVVRRDYGKATLISPKVVAAAQDYFGCDTLSEVPLEPSGGVGTAGGHWPSSLFGNRELMVATIGLERSVVSNVTLAVIEDSGWYAVNYDEATVGRSDFGRGMGCSLVENCNAEPSQMYCSEDDKRRPSLCSSDWYAVGACAQPLDGQCSVVKSFSNMVCRHQDVNMESLGYNPSDWGQSYGSGSRCLPISPDPQTWQKGNRFEYFGIGLGNTGGCFEVGCSEGNEAIRVKFPNGKEAECREGEYIEASSMDSLIMQGKIGPCPPPSDFCRTVGCPNDCSANGDCANGKCQCYLGYYGAECSDRQDPDPALPSSPTAATTTTAIEENESGQGLDATSDSQVAKPMSVKETTSSGGLPMKAIVISAIVFVGLLVLALSAWLALRARRRSRPQFQRMQSSAPSQCPPVTAPTPASPGLTESADLDGGVSGVKAFQILYGSDIKV